MPRSLVRFLSLSWVLPIALLLAPLSARAAPSSNLFVMYLEKMGPVPQSFEEFVEKLIDAGREYDKQLFEYYQTAIVPRGRSLQRNSVRFLRAISFRSGDTFIGYSPDNAKGEVISWNPLHREYDFLEFRGWGKGQKRLEVQIADRALCLSCHQSGGPIFPRAPWSEMVEDASFQKFGGQDPDLLGLAPAEREEKRFQNHHFFDLIVRRANRRLQFARSCNEMCGSKIECRQALLEIALAYYNHEDRHLELDAIANEMRMGRAPKNSPPNSPKDSPEFSLFPKGRLEWLQHDLASRWPADGFAIPSSTLLDRSAVSLSPGFQLRGALKNGEDPNYSDGFSDFTAARIPETAETAELNKARQRLLEEFISSPITEAPLATHETAAADPKSRRPLINKIQAESAAHWALATAFDCFSFSERELLPVRKFPRAAVLKAVESQAVTAELCEWPANQGIILEKLLTALRKRSSPRAKEPYCPRAEMPKVSSPLPLVTEVTEPVAAFSRYCERCHLGGEDEVTLKLQDLRWLGEYKRGTSDSVKAQLESGTMPPEESMQPSAKERAMMIQAIENAHRDSQSSETHDNP